MSGSRDPVFLERELYRRRRLVDALKLLPLLGMFLFLLPALLVSATQGDNASTAQRLIYFFAAWLSLIGLAFVLASWLRRAEDKGATRGDEAGQAE